MTSSLVYHLIGAALIGLVYGWLYTTNLLQSKIGILVRISIGIILASLVAINASKQPLYYQNHLIQSDYARMIAGIIIGFIMVMGWAATIWHYRKKQK